jgi:hypothetical protein
MTKLNDILFEGAKTSKEALKAGLGLYVSKTSEELIFVLFSPQRCKEVIDAYHKRHKGTLGKIKKEDPKPSPPEGFSTEPVDPRIPPWKTREEGEEFLRQQSLQEARDSKEARLDWLEVQLGNRAVVGSVTATWKDTQQRDDLWRVNTSSAVQKYGPMIYDLVMASVYPEYIRSDFSLTSASQHVWNVMYTRSDVEHSWIGNWGPDEVITSWNVSGMLEQDNIHDILNKIESETPISEKEFNNSFVSKLDSENKEKIGPFYAYRLSGGRSKTSAKLIDAGNAAIEELASSFGASTQDINLVLESAAGIQFDRLYQKTKRSS